MHLRRTLMCALLFGLLIGLALATAQAAEDRISVSGTLFLDEENGEIFGAYIQTEDREYQVSGVGTEELRENVGKEVTATGNVMLGDWGQWMIEVQRFRAAEDEPPRKISHLSCAPGRSSSRHSKPLNPRGVDRERPAPPRRCHQNGVFTSDSETRKSSCVRMQWIRLSRTRRSLRFERLLSLANVLARTSQSTGAAGRDSEVENAVTGRLDRHHLAPPRSFPHWSRLVSFPQPLVRAGSRSSAGR